MRLSHAINALIHSEAAAILALFFSVVFYFSWMRRKDKKWVRQGFAADEILAISFGTIRFRGRPSKKKVRKQKGFLILVPHALIFKPGASMFQDDIKKPAFEILKKDARRVYHSASHKGRDLNQSVINIDFINARGDMDSAAFKVPYPPQWLAAIDKCFF